MEKWVVASKKADFTQIGIDFGIDPVIARLIRNRDITGSEQIRQYLYGTLEDLPSPWKMKDMDRAVSMIGSAIKEKQRIRIIGDYDIDGVMAACILKKGFDRLGADADWRLPERLTDGYGLNRRLIEDAAADGIRLLVTCDNGIAAKEEIALARSLGLNVIVTDHHEIPYEETDEGRHYLLPPADALIDPVQKDCAYPDKQICGAVVAWKLVWALYETAGLPAEEILSFIDLAAFATIGDVMDLTGENRIIVREGLKALGNTRNEGLRQLIRCCGLEDRKISVYHVGFILGPCINAGGRLDTASRSMELLLEEDPVLAAQMAAALKELNESRKSLTEEGVEAALEQIRQEAMLLNKVLVVYLPDCHESLAGIIAGRIREKYNRPAIVLTQGEEMVKGSGRSIESYSMYEELTACEDLLEKFGGHPMAAGLSMKEENIGRLRERLNKNCRLTAEDLAQKVLIDAAMPIAYISKRLISQISLLEPFGKGNSKPLFAQKDLHVADSRVVGKKENVLRMHIEDTNGVTMQAVYFGDAKKMYEELRLKKRIAITYSPEISTFQGREFVQLVIQNYKVY